MFGHFMLVFLFGTFSHFSSVVPFYVVLVFPSVFLHVRISDQISWLLRQMVT